MHKMVARHDTLLAAAPLPIQHRSSNAAALPVSAPQNAWNLSGYSEFGAPWLLDVLPTTWVSSWLRSPPGHSVPTEHLTPPGCSGLSLLLGALQAEATHLPDSQSAPSRLFSAFLATQRTPGHSTPSWPFSALLTVSCPPGCS